MLPDWNERIRQRAYEIWEREGRPQGREAEHWRMANDELAREREVARTEETQAVPATRVSGPAAEPEEAQPSKPTDRPEPEADPLGLAQSPTGTPAPERAKTKRKRTTPRSRKPGNSAPPKADPERSR